MSKVSARKILTRLKQGSFEKLKKRKHVRIEHKLVNQAETNYTVTSSQRDRLNILGARHGARKEVQFLQMNKVQQCPWVFIQFIKNYGLYMFRALLAHPQEALHK
jgi:hypothetical protein